MEITQTNIHEFYKFVQDQITKITTQDGLDINNLVKNIMIDLDYLISYETHESQQCRIHYGGNSIEIRIWIFSLICMSWTLMNLTNKVKDGHCHNIDHQHGNQIPRECFDGRKFHYSIYQKCIRSFYDSLAVIEKDLDKYRF
ncbi:MAG TPA: hypothetical protein VFM31_00575 [Nitrososphaeraceae archaeon]|nr:hypothetical protein [Nitrososphaeraceae archaeon]